VATPAQPSCAPGSVVRHNFGASVAAAATLTHSAISSAEATQSQALLYVHFGGASTVDGASKKKG
jgi:hypothetical protein